MVRLRLAGLGTVMGPKVKVRTAGVEVLVAGAGGLYFVYHILWRKAYDVLCKNVENDGLCVFKLLVPMT
jgi:hypothetical protein